MERLFEGASAMRLDGAALVDESFLADSCAMADSRGALVLDRLTEDRAGVVAHTVAQSAALEYYERIVEARRPSRAQWHGVAADPAAAPFHRRRRQRAQRSARGVTPLGQAGRDVG